MQCTSYFPGYYSRQVLNGPSNGGPRPMYMTDVSPNMSDQSYNNFYHPQNLYHNEVLKQTILSHDNVFREQVQELHRLHRRQRELMDELKKREIKEPKISPTSHYNFIFSKVSSNCSFTLPWLNPSAFKLSTLSSSSPSPTFNFLNISPEYGNEELKKPKCKRLDLELPGDEYVERKDENGDKVGEKSTFSSKDKNLNTLAFDLNMPPQPEIFQNIGIQNRAKYVIDLNSCVDHEDEPLATKPIPKNIEIIPKIDLEAPLSPENKETSPPRGESEENLLEKNEDLETNDDLVGATAEMILSLNDKESAFLIQSLDWFAGVVLSAENGCVVALPSQQGKRHRKRRMNRKILEIETFGGKGFRGWGKTNKRRRGPRVRARSFLLLWN